MNELTPAQQRMIRALWNAQRIDEQKHGADQGWQELGVVVMDEAYGLPNGIGWTIANRVYGALERKGWIEHHPTYDDLIRLTEAARAAVQA